MSTNATAGTRQDHPAVAQAWPFKLARPPELPDLLHEIAEMLKGHPSSTLELELKSPAKDGRTELVLKLNAGLQRWSMRMGDGHFILPVQIFGDTAPANWGLLNFVNNRTTTLIFHHLAPPLSMEYVSATLVCSEYFEMAAGR